jgi:hypothetical protein
VRWFVKRLWTLLLDVFWSLDILGWFLVAKSCRRKVLRHHQGEQGSHGWNTGADNSNVSLNRGYCGLVAVVKCYVPGFGNVV